MQRRVVVLPHPEGPRRTTNSLSLTSRSRFSTATVPSNSLCRPLILTRAMSQEESTPPIIEFHRWRGLANDTSASTTLRHVTCQDHLGPRHRGDVALVLIDDVTLRHRHGATARDDPSLRGECRVPYGPQEVDLELQRC